MAYPCSRDIANFDYRVIASEAKQSSAAARLWIASSRSLLAMTMNIIFVDQMSDPGLFL
jgi:hypothetical protein